MIKRIAHPHLSTTLAVTAFGLLAVLGLHAASGNPKTAALAGMVINFSVDDPVAQNSATTETVKPVPAHTAPARPSSLQGVSNIGNSANIQAALASAPVAK